MSDALECPFDEGVRLIWHWADADDSYGFWRCPACGYEARDMPPPTRPT